MEASYGWTCPLCGYGCTLASTPADDWAFDQETAARHEAGHTVMRWLLDIPVGATCIHPDGSGYAAPANRRKMRLDLDEGILVMLAGYVVELGGAWAWDADLARVQPGCGPNDLMCVARLLTAPPGGVWQQMQMGATDEAAVLTATLQYHWRKTIDLIDPAFMVTEQFAWELQCAGGAFSQGKVSGFFRRKSQRAFLEEVGTAS